MGAYTFEGKSILYLPIIFKKWWIYGDILFIILEAR
jgi:hypothetical protein